MSKHEYRSKVLDAAEVQMLTEIGLMACGAGNVKQAEAIFEGLGTVRPHQSSWLIGLAMSRLEAGAAQEAVAIMRNASDMPYFKNPEFTVFFAMCLNAAGRRSEAERLLKEQLNEFQTDCPERSLALSLLHSYVTERHVIFAPQSLPETQTGRSVPEGMRSHHAT